MPSPTKGARLGGSPAHQRLMLANMATSLFEHGRITTTEAKARRLRPFAERLITKAKRGDLHNRRLVLKTIQDKSVVHELFTEIAPRYASRPGGYLRITKVGPRKGDNAPMAVIELVEEVDFTEKPEEPAKKSTAKKSAAKKSASKKSAAKKSTAKKATAKKSAAKKTAEAEAAKDEEAKDEAAEAEEAKDEAAEESSDVESTDADVAEDAAAADDADDAEGDAKS